MPNPNSKLIKDEDFIEDCRQAGKEEDAERGVHPRLRRNRAAPKRYCRACSRECNELTEDELCPSCDHTVRCLEDSKIDQPAGEPRKAARCSMCKLICWQDELLGDLCPECFKRHVSEIKGDDVG